MARDFHRNAVGFEGSFFVYIVLILALAGQVNCLAPVEQSTLLEIKKLWKDPKNSLQSWIKGKDCSTWKNLECNKGGSVTGLFLSGYNISGPIPTLIGNLKNVNYLDLSNNQFSGPFTSIFNLKNLGWLYLHSNKISGPIPASIGSLTKLTELDLHGNKISGPIPASIGNLKALTQFLAKENQLSGTIPAAIGSMNLDQLDLSVNQLSGPIPASIGNLIKLNLLNLSKNQLSGPIPASIGNLQNLALLDFHGNKISGSIPASIGKLKVLLLLDLSGNKLNGSIPTSLGNLSLGTLDLSGNQFSGLIPASIGNIPYVYLSNNQLSGPIPNFPNVTVLNLSNNYFVGGRPVYCGGKYSWCTLDLTNNCLKGGATGQRPSSQCAAFCGANSATGPCNGRGICAFNAQNKPQCTCEKGATPPNCVVKG